MNDAKKIAKDYKGDVMFVCVTTDEEEHKRVIDFFGIGQEVRSDSNLKLPFNRSCQHSGSRPARKTW